MANIEAALTKFMTEGLHNIVNTCAFKFVYVAAFIAFIAITLYRAIKVRKALDEYEDEYDDEAA